MSIKIRIPPILQEYTDGKDLVEVSGRNFKECLDELEVQFAGIKEQLCDKQGNLIDFYEMYINGESAYPGGLSRLLKDGDVVTIDMYFVGG